MDSSLRTSSSRTSRFRFRDHDEMENSPQSESSSDISSPSSEREDEAELQSMTGKGIERLCTELLELKEASEEDFQGSIFANYSVFVGIFAEVESITNEVVQLKRKVSAHKGLLNDLDGIYLKFLSDESHETIESTMAEVALGDEQSSRSKMEAHISNVSETLDILLSENRIDEAIAVLEMEEENSQKMQFEDDFPHDVLKSYASAISERRVVLRLQLTLVAENPRTAKAEFQKVLSGLCRLGYSHLATQLLTKYYHSRIATGIRDMDCSKSLLYGQYIRELAKFVFSMISQAARSFVMLYGEKCPFASELIQWVSEEIEIFGSSFKNYVTSISEIRGGLGKAAEAVQIAVSYCSLLESQRLVLRPYLVKYILPCMEEVFQIHIEHFKKVIGIFAATDAWVLGRYLVSGLMKGWCPSTVIGEQSEYCLLTNSGWKFVTVLQTITEDVAPLSTLQMEGSVVGGLVDLFMEYIVILERAITHETNGMEKGGSRINLAESLQQEVSVLVNLSTLKQFFSSLVTTISGQTNHIDPGQNKIQSDGIQDTELDSCIMFLCDASTKLRAHFFQQFINRLMSLETGPIPGVGNYNESQVVRDGCHGVVPSVPFQVLFLELRKLCKLAEENVFELDWLIELLRELMEAIFVWTTNNKEMWANIGKNSASHRSDCSHQGC
ncbi:exocyst complex component EXO84B-like isoform X2 [Tripterygium wilfordii]|uniref:exocyst complex component EXO84B-like isoform X2 n=1 Tax=Tripterygium wilfordii TaxID=458696 RepID=UPI0018F83B1E|nr:exocyst complex component EXO84B-like isoform X2 [Tripterygium wilfordii]